MKNAKIASLLLTMSFTLMLASCSEDAEKAAEVIKEKMEKKLVAAAGEGEVAMKLLRQQYADLKEQFVRVKTLKTGFERQAGEAKATAESQRKAGKEAEATINDRRAQMYTEKLDFLKTREGEAEAALREFAAVYEEQKANIELMQEEVEMYRTSAGIMDDSAIDSKISLRLESITGLKKSLQQKADRAKAIFDVGAVEKSFKP
jgi:hypothetical protein